MNIFSQERFDQYFMKMCYLVAEKSKDESTKVGCVIVYPDNGICSTGFNGFPRKVLGDQKYPINENLGKRKERPAKYLYTEHAERNAIFNAVMHGHCTNGCKIYVPWLPCADCARAIIQSGIVEVIMDDNVSLSEDTKKRWEDHHNATKNMFIDAKVSTRKINFSEKYFLDCGD